MRRIVFLHGLAEDDPEAKARLEAFREGLEALGWVDNRNIQIKEDGSKAMTKAKIDNKRMNKRIALA
jgi:DNA-binding LacI/PurR family transcriptional regulator